jgi:hypothetical protein
MALIWKRIKYFGSDNSCMKRRLNRLQRALAPESVKFRQPNLILVKDALGRFSRTTRLFGRGVTNYWGKNGVRTEMNSSTRDRKVKPSRLGEEVFVEGERGTARYGKNGELTSSFRTTTKLKKAIEIPVLQRGVLPFRPGRSLTLRKPSIVRTEKTVSRIPPKQRGELYPFNDTPNRIGEIANAEREAETAEVRPFETKYKIKVKRLPDGTKIGTITRKSKTPVVQGEKPPAKK